MLTPEELMKPRYKVIAGMPFGKFEIGDILKRQMVQWHPEKEAELMWMRRSGKNHNPAQSVGIPMIKNPEDYPHLFYSLSWWEERSPEDMPEYLKFVGENYKCAYRVSKYNVGFNVIGEPLVELVNEDCLTHKQAIGQFSPATESEYNNQQK